ncbi:unnamed protein product [Miscanthus lutarioriparius]|uniref:Protein kinase domain-containing protein n=1 Tax=Miscanthus lutarioriparius TaxID=422564 RepID=A0A811R1R6_9POAL|nr:unnamed protein product [Miscanthus lutarioriparius]
MSGTPFRFSDVHNKFTVIGCNTLAYILDNAVKGYQSGCVSTCQDLSDLADGSCSGMGCCQTAIPKGMGFYNMLMSERAVHALQEVLVTTLQEGTGVTVGFLVLVIFSSFGYMILQKRKLNQVKQEHFRQHGGMILLERMRSEKGLAFTVFSEAELVKATDNYDKSRIIGKGGHGTVYKGIVKGNMHVAIKRCALIDERQNKEFGQEMLILSQINHKNIVKLEGCCLEVEVPMLVYEFIPNGTLYELIHGKNQALQIPFSTLLRIAHEAAEGLNFLHSYACPPIIHGDVKSANILLDGNYMAKVSDFGASILAPSDKEQYHMSQWFKILTGQEPLKLDGPETQRSLSSSFLSAMKENNLDAILPSHVKGQESNELIRGLAELAKQCLDMCGSNRPVLCTCNNEHGEYISSTELKLVPRSQVPAQILEIALNRPCGMPTVPSSHPSKCHMVRRGGVSDGHV